jgi:hypothetical protein
MNQRDRIRMIWSMIQSYDFQLDNGSYRDWKNGLKPSELVKQEKAESKIFEILNTKTVNGHEIYDDEVFEKGGY